MTIRTLLFDLDGTLLPFDQDRFMKGYFAALLPQIQHLVDKEQIVTQIWTSTTAAIRNEDPALTNMDAFKQSFFASTGIREDDIWPIFELFYEQSFSDLKHLTNPTPISQEICRTAVDKGYQLVLATNPVFPERAIRHRMEWAGVGNIPFKLVTTMEEMHFCKPNPKYFIEILDRVESSPFEAMMFGNDVQEDGVAGKLGLQTYLVKDQVIDRGIGHLDFTHEGYLTDALTFVQQLPRVSA